jgi:hypothetical protein
MALELAAPDLDGLPVDLGPDLEVMRVFDDIARHDSRTVRCPSVKTLSERPLAATVLDLPVSVGDVVAYGVTQNVVKCFGFRDVLGGLSDDGDQLALIVQAGAFLGDGMNWNGIERTRERSSRLILYPIFVNLTVQLQGDVQLTNRTGNFGIAMPAYEY